MSRALLAHRGLLPEPEPEPVAEPEPELEHIPLVTPAYIEAADNLEAEGATVSAAEAEPADDSQTTTASEPEVTEGTTASDNDDVTDDAPIEGEDEGQDASEPAPEPARQAMLAVRLGNQEALRRLPRERLMTLLERYRQQVQRACQLYGGEQHTLFDGTSVLLFRDTPEAGGAELKHSLCCGELLRVLGHDLQIEIADTGTALHLQLALGHAAGLVGLDEKALVNTPPVSRCWSSCNTAATCCW
ncbi:hypothetical protein UMZ34_02525 [Halopseudomonas pachastrellae]|nr:hypothetical protein UMZ34_02525 [Halopseudomonas pachastrellae]